MMENNNKTTTGLFDLEWHKLDQNDTVHLTVSVINETNKHNTRVAWWLTGGASD